MMWKLFAIAMAVFFAVGLTYSSRDIFDLVSIPIDGIAIAGLLVYAFGFQRVHIQLWMAFAWFFAAWSVFSVVWGIMKGVKNGSPVYAIVVGSIIAAVLLYANWLALHRIGHAQFASR